MEALVTDAFAGHVLSFDMNSSARYADILVNRARAGRAGPADQRSRTSPTPG